MLEALGDTLRVLKSASIKICYYYISIIDQNPQFSQILLFGGFWLTLMVSVLYIQTTHYPSLVVA